MSEKPDIKELAVAAWRLDKWLSNLNVDRKMAAKSALRSIKKYLEASGIVVKDPLGAKFDPGLAIEVINNEAEDTPEDELIITETLSPYIYQDGQLIQYARVIIGTCVKGAIDNAEIQQGEIVSVSSAAPSEEITEVKDGTVDVTNESSGLASVRSTNPDEEIQISSDEIERMMAYAKIL